MFKYDPGTGSQEIDFYDYEAAQNVIRDNCAVDVQTFKNKLVKLYLSPVSYKTFDLTFVTSPDVVDKYDILKAVRVKIRFYYQYNRDDSVFKNVYIIPCTEKYYAAGGLSVQDLKLSLIETELTPGTYWTLTRSGTVRYMYMNSLHTGYVISSTRPSGYLEEESIEAFKLTAATTVYAYLNSTFNGLAFANSLPGWVVTPPVERASFNIRRDEIVLTVAANSTCNGIKLTEET